MFMYSDGVQNNKRRSSQPRLFIRYMKIFAFRAKKHPISGMLFYQNPMVDDITAALHPHAPYKGNYLVKQIYHTIIILSSKA